MEFAITSEQILGFCGLITALFGVWKIVKEVKKPSDDLKAKVNHHDELLNNDNERLKDIEQSNKLILNCMFVLINHDLTGNGIDKMKEARDELQEYLINK
jgi:cadmium resistance protein CadD (predicted permease)